MDQLQTQHWMMASEIAHRLAAERAQAGPLSDLHGARFQGKAPGEHGDRNTGPLTLPGWGRALGAGGASKRKQARQEGRPDKRATGSPEDSASGNSSSGGGSVGGSMLSGEGSSPPPSDGSEGAPEEAPSPRAAAALGAQLRAASRSGLSVPFESGDTFGASWTGEAVLQASRAEKATKESNDDVEDDDDDEDDEDDDFSDSDFSEDDDELDAELEMMEGQLKEIKEQIAASIAKRAALAPPHPDEGGEGAPGPSL